MSENEVTPGFEDLLMELEDTIARLEAGNLPLEESLALYERGQELAKLCEQALSHIELRLEELRTGQS